jgi:hypothetical protein
MFQSICQYRAILKQILGTIKGESYLNFFQFPHAHRFYLGTYEELRFIPDEALRQFAFPVSAWFDKHFPSRCCGRHKRNGMAFLLFISVNSAKQEFYLPKPKTPHKIKETSKYFDTILLGFSVKTGTYIADCRSVCTKLVCSFSSISADMAVWDLQWCQTFSIITNQLEDTAILRIYLPVTLY